MVNFTNQRHTLVDADDAAVQRQVVVLGVAPLHVGVEAVIRRAAFILIPQALLRGLLPLTVDLHDALGAERHVRMDKDLQAGRRVLQNVVGTAANNDARAFFRESGDRIALMLPQNILVGGAECPVGKGCREKSAGSIFSGFFDIIGCK